ncbi:hypothetical protein WJX81_008652 [Elliptochloris bilobata]|uniref:Transcription factor IIIC subunit 5 HTH domain-containing protein n=1 Tax=Elliptochloris bilobata TaxID=381761 RepID=A0AAW1RMY4_9CHLO
MDEHRQQVVARVPFAYRFSGLADFQYVAHDARPPEERMPPARGPYGADMAPLMTVPSAFATVDVPLDYGFRSFFAGDPEDYKLGMGQGRGTGRQAPHVVNFYNLATPVAVTQGPSGTAEAAMIIEKRLLVRELLAVLAERPVWALPLLAARASPAAAADVEVLKRVAYVFRNGPWKGLWVRRGYDPRLDPAARRWQVMELPVPIVWRQRVEAQQHARSGDAGASGSAAAAGPGLSNGQAQPPPSPADAYRFACLPAEPVAQLQVGDLEDAGVQAALRLPPRAAPCDARTGWCTQEAWQHIYARLCARYWELAEPNGQRGAHEEGPTAMAVDDSAPSRAGQGTDSPSPAAPFDADGTRTAGLEGAAAAEQGGEPPGQEEAEGNPAAEGTGDTLEPVLLGVLRTCLEGAPAAGAAAGALAEALDEFEIFGEADEGGSEGGGPGTADQDWGTVDGYGAEDGDEEAESDDEESEDEEEVEVDGEESG